jgi:ABC-type transporter Mla maintaining outer membrane lipid asymmetry permease subunit MlaE
MMDEMLVNNIAAIIQLALAPAFLLVGIGAMLQLFSGRLARVVDRSRDLAAKHGNCSEDERKRVVGELRILDQRMTVVNRSILMAVCGAITVSMVITMLFAMELAGIDLSIFVATGFIIAMTFIMSGLCFFLYEVRLADKSIHLDAIFFKE